MTKGKVWILSVAATVLGGCPEITSFLVYPNVARYVGDETTISPLVVGDEVSCSLAGSLPQGMKLESNCNVSGTPQELGKFEVSIVARYANSNSAEARLVVSVISKRGKVLYTGGAEGQNGPSRIKAYAIDSEGHLSPSSDHPVVVTANNYVPLMSLAVNPLNGFVYGVAYNKNSVFITPTSEGILKLQTAEVSTGPWPGAGSNPRNIAVDPGGQFVYTANYQGGVSLYKLQDVQKYGLTYPMLVPIVPPHYLLNSPKELFMHPSGNFLYVAQDILGKGVLSTLSVDQTSGVLTSKVSSLELPGSAFSMAIDSTGRFAHIASKENQNTTSLNLYSIARDTGALTASSLPALALETQENEERNVVKVAMDPLDRFVHFLECRVEYENIQNGPPGLRKPIKAENVILSYRMDRDTGALTFSSELLTGHPCSDTNSIITDRSGQYVFVSHQNTTNINNPHHLSQFRVNEIVGTLTTNGEIEVSGVVHSMAVSSLKGW